MLVLVITLSSFLTISVKCNVIKLVDPTFQEFSMVDYNKTKMFSTLSPYLMQEECTPTQAWLMTRHGIKYPSEDIMSDITNELVPLIQDELNKIYSDPFYFEQLKKNNKKKIKSIIEWKNVFLNGSHKDLNNHGKLCMTELGGRWNSKLKKMTQTLKVEEIEVFSSSEDRCFVSAKKFLSVFFEGDHDDIQIKRLKLDSRLKLSKPLDEDVMIENPKKPGEKIYAEKYFFDEHSNKITMKIKKLLFPDFIKDHAIYQEKVTNEMVYIMYNACVNSQYYFDKGEESSTGAWCWLFTYHDLQIYEDMHDLENYYKLGYYLENNRKMGNAITNDLLIFLTQPTGIKFRAFFGHKTNCLSLITRFNLFRDNVPLNVHNIRSRKDRKWRTSFIAHFGCNIMVVMFDCGYVNMKVSIYVNEHAVEMTLDGGHKCVKCPLVEVVKLIESYKTFVVPVKLNKTTSFKYVDQKKLVKQLSLRRKQYMQEKIAEDMRKRFDEVFDESKEYFDVDEMRSEES